MMIIKAKNLIIKKNSHSGLDMQLELEQPLNFPTKKLKFQ